MLSASSSPPSTAAPTRRRRPAPGRLTARRGALTRAQWRRRERSEATEQSRGSARCEHSAEPHHLAPTDPAARRSKIIRMCLSAVGGGERVDHRRRPSLRRLMMSAFGPPPAPLRSALSGGQPAPASVEKQVPKGQGALIERLPDGLLEKCAPACHGHDS